LLGRPGFMRSPQLRIFSFRSDPSRQSKESRDLFPGLVIAATTQSFYFTQDDVFRNFVNSFSVLNSPYRLFEPKTDLQQTENIRRRESTANMRFHES
jgi:hypothetical protein